MHFSVPYLHATSNEYTIPLSSDGMVSFVASHGVAVLDFTDGLVRVRIAEDFTHGGLLAMSANESAFIPIHRNAVSPVLALQGTCLVLNTYYLQGFRLFHREDGAKRLVDITRLLDVAGWTGSLLFVGTNQSFTYDLAPAPAPVTPAVSYHPALTYRNNRVELHLRVENVTQPLNIRLRGDFIKDVELHEGGATCSAVNSSVFGVEKWFEFTVNEQFFRCYICKLDKLPTHLLPTAQPGRYRLNQPSPIALVAVLDSGSIPLLANSLFVDTGTTTSVAVYTHGEHCVFTQALEATKSFPALRILPAPLRAELDGTSKVPVTFRLRGYPTLYRIEPGNRTLNLELVLAPGLRCLVVEGVENAQVLENAFYILR